MADLGMSAYRYYRLIKGEIGVSNERMLQLRRYQNQAVLVEARAQEEGRQGWVLL